MNINTPSPHTKLPAKELKNHIVFIKGTKGEFLKNFDFQKETPDTFTLKKSEAQRFSISEIEYVCRDYGSNIDDVIIYNMEAESPAHNFKVGDYAHLLRNNGKRDLVRVIFLHVNGQNVGVSPDMEKKIEDIYVCMTPNHKNLIPIESPDAQESGKQEACKHHFNDDVPAFCTICGKTWSQHLKDIKDGNYSKSINHAPEPWFTDPNNNVLTAGGGERICTATSREHAEFIAQAPTLQKKIDELLEALSELVRHYNLCTECEKQDWIKARQAIANCK